MIAYKLCRKLKDGSITSLFINKTKRLPFDELLKSAGGNYRDGFQYIIFDAYEFTQLLRKFHFTKEPLYEHLAYKFDKIFIKKED